MAAKSGGYISVEGAVSGTQSARTTEVTSTTPSFTLIPIVELPSYFINYYYY